jgi:hypothetical protein
MKVTFCYGVKGYRGNVDGMLFYEDKRTGVTYGRKEFTFENHPGQPQFRNVQQQIYAIKPSEDFIENLRDYLYYYNHLPENRLHRLRSWTNVYNKIMFAMQKAMPETVDLKTITREQVYEQNLPCKTLKAAIDAGYLPKVRGWEGYNNLI